MGSHRFRQMCLSNDENMRLNRKPVLTNNEHDYSTWNINDDYGDMDLSEYLIDTKEADVLAEPEVIQTPAVDETQNFDAPALSKSTRRYSCPVCHKLWVTPSKLKRHMSVHRLSEKQPLPKIEEEKNLLLPFESEVKEPEVQCPICFLAIESQAKLAQHMTSHMKVDNRVQAPSEPTFLIPIAHKIGKQYICSLCSIESSTPTKLQSHMKSQHMRRLNEDTKKKLKPRSTFNPRPKKKTRRKRPRNHSCQHCEKQFETPSKLQRHQSVHRDVYQASGKRDFLESSPILEISAVTSILGD